MTFTFDLWRSDFVWWIDYDSTSVLYEFQIDISSTNSREIKYRDMGLGLLHVLNVAHVKNYVKWRPIITKCVTLIDNMCRTELYDCISFRFVLTILWEIVTAEWEFYMVKSNIDAFFVWRHFSAFVLFHRIEYPKGSMNKMENFLWLSFCDMTIFKKQCTVPVWPWPLTYKGNFLVNWVQPYNYPV